MYVCVSHVCLEPEEVRKEVRSSEIGSIESCKLLWVLGIEPRSPKEQ